jgi:hypothetical protein
VASLTADAEARLKQNGPNALTPPKKKSALQKVGVYIFTGDHDFLNVSTVHRLPQVHVQHHLDRLRYSRVYPPWYRLPRELRIDFSLSVFLLTFLRVG